MPWLQVTGITGNEKADKLAKTGAKEKQMGPETVCGNLKTLIKSTIDMI